MRLSLALFCTAALIVSFSLQANAATPGEANASEEPLRIWFSPELEGMTKSWANDYAIVQPGTKILPEVLVQGSRIPDGTIALVPGKTLLEEPYGNAWRMVIGRELVVPIMNTGNPYIAEINRTGLDAADLAAIYAGKTGAVLRGNQEMKLNALLPGDEKVVSYMANFMETDPREFNGTIAVNSGLPDRVSRDIYAIGFCRLTDLVEFNNTHPGAGLSIVPIDINGDNNLDQFENIYGSLEAFTRGVWIGKYPKSLYSRIYAIATLPPVEGEMTHFLGWLVSDGQQRLSMNGLSELSMHEKQSAMNHLQASAVPVSTAGDASKPVSVFLVLAGVIVAAIVLLMVFVRIFRDRSKADEGTGTLPSPGFSEETISMPGGVFFDRSHTWAFMERNGNVRTGIDDFLLHATGRITRVKMKKPGEVVHKGEIYISLIQDGKQLDILSPVSGTIKESNPYLYAGTFMLNTDPLDGGWIYKIEPMNWMREIRGFLMGDGYREWIGDEYRRLKEFLVRGVVMNEKVGAQLVLQDGGEIKTGVLAQFGPEVWEEFQIGFINLVR